MTAFRVAVVQAGSVVFDREGALEKMADLAKHAAADGALRH
jgi:predicted amidohydrolase